MALADDLDIDETPNVEQDQSRRHIRDDDHAHAVARKAREHADRIAEKEAQYRRFRAKLDAEIAELDDWLTDVTAGDRRELTFREGQLDEYLHTLADGATKQVTHKLPFVDLVFKPGSPSVAVDDKDAFIAWAAEHEPGALRTTDPKPAETHVDKDALKQLVGDGRPYQVTEDGEVFNPFAGEVVPGVRIVRTPTYSVTFAPLDIEEAS